jgi:hypothetical protein
MTGFRIIIANLTGSIIADARCDGDSINWTGKDLPSARIAVTAAQSVIVQMPAAWVPTKPSPQEETP